MIEWIKRTLRELAVKRRIARDIHPDSFRALAGELVELADIAARIRPDEHAFQLRVKRIKREMDDLARMTGRPEFRMLPRKKRLELRESLLSSRDQLLKTVSDAPVPTTLRQ
ncbi:hypothetical protein [Desulfolutivibrio sulfoxidireducens]|uniref:hypothetical protein n=1 Tax=Desulfolutivibrio sulfoxidireducens TaxID=2773299 RepID=UPI00159D96D4|nr:hypothetical protein [Desulfolutivibrio sulfoxidireducens]QLA15156.1 hypothetical protein GD605_02880 [Desulfolutivibrio sulfoxidireducens]QLA18727.1 hypothetical protein GD604_02780 [Desulfolutivibrio sulfoxidireducens]